MGWFKSKRALIAEIKELTAALETRRAEFRDLRDSRIKALSEKADLAEKYSNLINKHDALDRKYQKLQKDHSKLVSDLREQNDADLFLCAEKIKNKVLKGEKPSQSLRDEFAALQNQRQLFSQQAGIYQQRPSSMSGLQGLLGGSI